jgi:hypothetical protein
MRARLFVCLIFVSIALGGEEAIGEPTPTATATPPAFDACTLIQSKEVETIQGSPIKEAKSSERADGDFRVSQCFYTAADFSRSVTFVVFQKNPTGPSNRDPLEFWDRTFARYEKQDKEPDKKEPEGKARREEEEEERVPPRKIDKLGDGAFWISNRFGGTLYVLKGDRFMSISLGGTDPEPAKIDKSKKLASKALGRFK